MPTDPRPLHNCDHESAGGGHCTLPVGHQPLPGLVEHEWCYCDDVPCSAPWLTDASPKPDTATSALEEACRVLGAAFPGVDLGDVSDVLAALPAGVLRRLADEADDTAGPQPDTPMQAQAPEWSEFHDPDTGNQP